MSTCLSHSHPRPFHRATVCPQPLCLRDFTPHLTQISCFFLLPRSTLPPFSGPSLMPALFCNSPQDAHHPGSASRPHPGNRRQADACCHGWGSFAIWQSFPMENKHQYKVRKNMCLQAPSLTACVSAANSGHGPGPLQIGP